MKKTILLLTLIVSTFFISCSTKQETKIMKNMYQNVDDALLVETNTFNYIIVSADKIYLWDLAEKYLGDGLRHMEIANMNYQIFKHSDRFRFTGMNPHWTYGVARFGEKIYLPADAYGPDVHSEKTTLTYLKKGINIKDYSVGDLEVVTNDSGPGTLVADTITSRNSTMDMPELLIDLMWLLVAIAMILVTAFIIYLIFKWLRSYLDSTNNRTNHTSHTSETESTSGDTIIIIDSFNTKIKRQNYVSSESSDNDPTSADELKSCIDGAVNIAVGGGKVSFDYKKGNCSVTFNGESKK